MISLASRIAGLSQEFLCGAGCKVSVALISIIELIGILLCGISTGYIVFFCTDSLVAAVFLGVVVVVLLRSVQAITLSNYALVPGESPQNIKSLKPAKFRLVIFLLVGAIFSQPLVLGLYNNFKAEDIDIRLRDIALVKKEILSNELAQGIDLLGAQIALKKENLRAYDSPSGSQELEKGGVQADPRRKALVIGNQNYSIDPLNNSAKDAKDIAAALKKMGFNVTLQLNLSKDQMETIVGRYLNSLKTGDISVFYYSGHGYQDRGTNYLVPVDFSPNDANRSISLNLILEAISSKKINANVGIIDACRTFINRSSEGLAQIEAGSNTYIALPAKPGHTASDGKPGSNGAFTGSLLKYINDPVDVDSIFRKVREDVSRSTNDQQQTWSSHNLKSRVILSSLLSNSHDVKRTEDASTCSTLTRNMSADTLTVNMWRCIRAEIAKLEDDLVALKSTDSALEVDLSEIESKSMSPERLLEVYDSVWVSPTQPFFWSVFFSFAVSLGFVLRHMMYGLMKPYIFEKYQGTCALVEDAHFKIEEALRSMPFGNSIDGEDERFGKRFFAVREEKPKTNALSRDEWFEKLKSKSAS